MFAGQRWADMQFLKKPAVKVYEQGYDQINKNKVSHETQQKNDQLACMPNSNFQNDGYQTNGFIIFRASLIIIQRIRYNK